MIVPPGLSENRTDRRAEEPERQRARRGPTPDEIRIGFDAFIPMSFDESGVVEIVAAEEKPDHEVGIEGEIPFVARIIAVADTFDAMISRRHYRIERSPAIAMEELIEVAGKQLDLDVVAAFESSFERVCEALATAVTTFVVRVLPEVTSPFTARDLWRTGLMLSYRAELRTEDPGAVVALFDAEPTRYEQLTRAAVGGICLDHVPEVYRLKYGVELVITVVAAPEHT